MNLPAVSDLVEELKPLLRGWLHLVMVPLALASGIVLVSLAEGTAAKAACAVYAATAVALFSISALYHRRRWGRRGEAIIRRLDHSTIYLFIAGSYTPFAVLTLSGAVRIAVLSVVWSGAVLGVIFRTTWLGAPRWLLTALYLLLGWALVSVLPEFARGAGVAAFALVCVGGGLYSLGALVYGFKWPRLSPRVFGFHELFHSLVVAAFVTQYVAVSLVTYRT
jgi:hemolysin III